MKRPKLGSGKRFQQLAHKLAKQGVDDPDAVAASIGRKRYGNKKMAQLSKIGKERHSK